MTTPAGALGLYFLFFVLLISLFACSQIGAAHREEGEGRLEMLLVSPLGRRRWLTGHLLLALISAVTLALFAGLLAWAGAEAAHAGVSLPRMLEAAANWADSTGRRNTSMVEVSGGDDAGAAAGGSAVSGAGAVAGAADGGVA